LYLSERNIYGSSRLGMENVNYLIASTNATNIEAYAPENVVVGDKAFELSNHLGNVLNVVTDRKIPEFDATGDLAFFNAVVVGYSDYYPFGMQRISGGTLGRYGFNGMESIDEVSGAKNSYDFGARLYDPRIGRWLSIDPLASKYPSLSPYNFVNNNPIIYVDIDGKDFVITIDQNNKTITIAEKYYIEDSKDKASLDAMNIGAEFWNSQSDKFVYLIKNDKGELISYDVKFKITTEVIQLENGNFTEEQGKQMNAGSSVTVYPHEVLQRGESHDEGGADIRGKGFARSILISEKNATDKETIAHEFGHNLGLTHKFGLMNSTLNGILNITPHDIKEILGRAGIGDNKNLKGEKWLGGTMRGEVQGDPSIGDNFNLDGKVYTKEKAEKIIKKDEKKKEKAEK
jgi:RHS repeat-associated protein